MSEQQGNKNSSTEEIDLGQLFRMIGRGFTNVFRGLLSVFLYLKRNILWLGGLVLVGVALGFALKTFITEKQKLDVIVTPLMDNSEYLKDVISEIQSDIKAKDTTFFNSLGMEMSSIEHFEVELTPLRDARTASESANMEFLELLKEFGESEAVGDIVRSELQDKTTRDHRITFYFKDPNTGEEYARKMIDYINSNEFYQKLNTVFRLNATERISRNDSLIAQIDVLIRNYTAQMNRESTATQGTLVLESQEPLNIPSLLNLKNQLIKDTEEKRLELIRREDAIRVVNFGKPHRVEKPLFGKWVVLIPLVFIGLFFLASMLKYLNRKAIQMQKEA